MHARYIHILMYFTRLAASTLIVPAVLVTGLLSFPTTCTCGADYPHEHPLFGIAGHHHGHQQPASSRHDAEVIHAGGSGITVQASSGMAAPALTAMRAADVNLQSIPRAALAAVAVNTPAGIHAAPDVPPPQA